MSDTATGRRPVRDFPPDENEAAGAGARELAARPVAPGRLAYGLSAALAAVTAGAMAGTYLMPGLLRGPAVMNGSARGAALAVLLAGVPVLAGSMLLAARGSAGAVITWLGGGGVPAVQLGAIRLRYAGEPAVPRVPGDAGAGRLVGRDPAEPG